MLQSEIPFFDFLTYVSLDSLHQLSDTYKRLFYHVTCPTAHSLSRSLFNLHHFFNKNTLDYGSSLEDFDGNFESFYTKLIISLYGNPNCIKIYSSLKDILQRITKLLKCKYRDYFCSTYRNEFCISFAAVFVFVVKLFCRLADEQQNLIELQLFDLLVENSLTRFKSEFSKERFNQNWNILLVPLFEQQPSSVNDGIMRDFGRIKSKITCSAPLNSPSCSFNGPIMFS